MSIKKIAPVSFLFLVSVIILVAYFWNPWNGNAPFTPILTVEVLSTKSFDTAASLPPPSKTDEPSNYRYTHPWGGPYQAPERSPNPVATCYETELRINLKNDMNEDANVSFRIVALDRLNNVSKIWKDSAIRVLCAKSLSCASMNVTVTVITFFYKIDELVFATETLNIQH